MTAPSLTPASNLTNPVLYLVGCAAPPLLHVRSAIVEAKAHGYDVCLILTPTGAQWLEAEISDLAELTGHPVRDSYKQPGAPDTLPSPDAFLVAPATANTINKWAAGIADTLALGLVTEASGRGTQPIVALPYLNSWQANHIAFDESIERLRSMGVHVLLGTEGYTPHVPHTGTSRPDQFPWHTALGFVDKLTDGNAES